MPKWHLQPTIFVRHLDTSNILENTQLLSTPVSQFIQRLQRDVESFIATINSQNSDVLVLVYQFPAGTTLRRIPPLNKLNSANVWEGFQSTKGLETFGQETVLAVRASNIVQRLGLFVVGGIVGHFVDRRVSWGSASGGGECRYKKPESENAG